MFHNPIGAFRRKAVYKNEIPFDGGGGIETHSLIIMCTRMILVMALMKFIVGRVG